MKIKKFCKAWKGKCWLCWKEGKGYLHEPDFQLCALRKQRCGKCLQRDHIRSQCSVRIQSKVSHCYECLLPLEVHESNTGKNCQFKWMVGVVLYLGWEKKIQNFQSLNKKDDITTWFNVKDSIPLGYKLLLNYALE